MFNKVNHTRLEKNNNNEMTLLMDRLKSLIQEWEETNQKKFVQAHFAQNIGVTRATVGDWIKGRTNSISGEALFKAADYFNVSSSWLQSGKGNKAKLTSINNDKPQQLDEIANPEQIIDILDIIRQTVGIEDFFTRYTKQEQERQIKILITALNTDISEQQAKRLLQSIL